MAATRLGLASARVSPIRAELSTTSTSWGRAALPTALPWTARLWTCRLDVTSAAIIPPWPSAHSARRTCTAVVMVAARRCVTCAPSLVSRPRLQQSALHGSRSLAATRRGLAFAQASPIRAEQRPTTTLWGRAALPTALHGPMCNPPPHPIHRQQPRLRHYRPHRLRCRHPT